MSVPNGTVMSERPSSPQKPKRPVSCRSELIGFYIFIWITVLLTFVVRRNRAFKGTNGERKTGSLRVSDRFCQKLTTCSSYRELKHRRRRRQWKRWKSNRFRLAKQQLCTCITLFFTFLCRHCTTITFTVEDGNARQKLSFSFPELWYSVLEFNSNTFVNIWRSKRDGISAIKFEAARLHCFSDVFKAFAVVVA